MKTLKDIVLDKNKTNLNEVYNTLVGARELLGEIAIQKLIMLSHAEEEVKKLMDIANHMEANQRIQDELNKIDQDNIEHTEHTKELVETIKQTVATIMKDYVNVENK